MTTKRMLRWALFCAGYQWGRVLYRRQQLIWGVKK